MKVVSPKLTVIISIIITVFSIHGLSLEEYLEIVSKNNTSIKLKERVFEKSKWNRLQSYSDYMPELNISTGLHHSQHLHDRLNAPDADTDASLVNLRNPSWSRRVTVSLPVFLGGRRVYGNLIAKEQYDISEIDIEYERLRIEAMAVAAYFKAFITQENIKLSEKSLKSAQENLRTAKLLFDSGRSTELAYLNFDLNYQMRRQELENYRMEMKSNIAEMSMIAATDIKFESLESSDYEVVEEKFGETTFLTAYEEHKRYLHASSPLLEKMRRLENISKYNRKMVWSNFVPSISFLYTHDFGSSEKHPFRSTYLYEDDIIALNFSWNLFRGFKDALEWKKASADTVISHLNYVDTKNRQIYTLETVLSNLYSLMEQKSVAEKTVELALKALEQSRVEYESGKALYLDLLNAENNYFESVRNLVFIENSLLNSFYQLRILVGTGER